MQRGIHHNISDLYKSLNLPIKQEIDFTIHFLPDIHAELPFKSPVFRAEYFSFVFIKEGLGNYTLDDKVFPFEAQTIYFTNPGHIKSFDIQESKDPQCRKCLLDKKSKCFKCLALASLGTVFLRSLQTSE